jgi:hypothetical protein
MERLDELHTKSNGRSLDDILSNGYQLDAMAAISRGFNILGKDLGSYLGFCILSFVISIIVGMIPYLGTIAMLLVGPALHAGYAYYLKSYLHQNSSEFSNFFNGFKQPQVIQLAIANFIAQAIILVISGLVILAFCGNIFSDLYDSYLALSNPTNREAQEAALEYFLNAQNIAGISTASLLAGLLSLLWILTSQFIVFREMPFGDALEASRKIVMKKYFSFLGWLIVWGIILIVSALPCGLGLLFTYPAMMLSIYALYMQITEDESVLNQ